MVLSGAAVWGRSVVSEQEKLFECMDVRKYFPVYGGFPRREVNSVKAVDGVSLDIRLGETLVW